MKFHLVAHLLDVLQLFYFLDQKKYSSRMEKRIWYLFVSLHAFSGSGPFPKGSSFSGKGIMGARMLPLF